MKKALLRFLEKILVYSYLFFSISCIVLYPLRVFVWDLPERVSNITTPLLAGTVSESIIGHTINFFLLPVGPLSISCVTYIGFVVVFASAGITYPIFVFFALAAADSGTKKG